MKKFPWLLLLLPMLILGGCGKAEEPPTPQPYGKLAAITYSRTHGSMYGYDFYMNLTPEEIDYTDYFLEGDLLVKEKVPVEHIGHHCLRSWVSAIHELRGKNERKSV